MPEFPTIAHVTLTVSDLDRSVPWYERLFEAKPVLDEDPGPFRRAVWLVGGQTVVGLHQFRDSPERFPFDERRCGLDHLVEMTLKHGRSGWTNSVSPMGVSSMPITAPACPSVIPTTSHWNFSCRPPRTVPSGRASPRPVCPTGAMDRPGRHPDWVPRMRRGASCAS